MFIQLEYYSFLKKEVLPFATTWMNLEHIMLSEISHTQKKKVHDLTHRWNLKKKSNAQKQSRTVVTRWGKRGGAGQTVQSWSHAGSTGRET